jgi:hypothetical protein
MNNYTEAEKALYNVLLDLNYSEPYITLGSLAKVTGTPRRILAPLLGDLVTKGKVLAGNEDVMGDIIHTYTPIVSRGLAYGYPLDYYTYEEWSGFAL